MEGSYLFGAGGGRGRAVNFTPAKLKIVCMYCTVAMSVAREVRGALLDLVSRELQ